MGSTLAELRAYARVRADAVSNAFFTESEIDKYLNVALGELHDILVQKFEDYYIEFIKFNLEGDKSKYTFDEIGLSNFYKCLGVDVNESGSNLRVHRFSFPERHRYDSDVTLVGRGGHADYQYQIQGDSINFIPVPTTTSEITIWYAPSFEELLADTDKVSSQIMSNWEEYAIITTVYKMKEKEELSTTVIERELETLRVRIDEAASNRDAGEPFGISDEMIGTSDGWMKGFS